jgi:beta-lactamase regulating signal transducer with metallopeptidase domain
LLAAAAAVVVEPIASEPVPSAPVAWPAGVWLLGTLVLLARLAMGRIALARLLRRGRPVTDEALAGNVRTLAARVGLRLRLRLIELPGLPSPMACGWRRPTVGVPAGFADEWSTDQQSAVLAHELAHLAARDPAWHLLADLACAALWWHPAVWWSSARLRLASELAADEASLVLDDGPAALAACLVELGRRLTQPRRFAGIAAAGGNLRSALARRVERLLGLERQPWRPPGRRGWTAALAGAALVASVALLSTGWAHRPAEPASGEPPMKAFRESWRQSLGAIAVAALLSAAPQQPALAWYPDEGAGEAAREGDDVGHHIDGLLQKIDALRADGQAEAAAELEQELRRTVDEHFPKLLERVPEEARGRLEELKNQFFELRAAGR